MASSAQLPRPRPHRDVWLLAGLMLLAAAVAVARGSLLWGQGARISGDEPVSMECDDFVARWSKPDRVTLSDCMLDLRSGLVTTRAGRSELCAAVVDGTGTPSTVVCTSRSDVLSQVGTIAAAHVNEVDGFVRYLWTVEDRQRQEIEDAIPGLADGFVIVDEGVPPRGLPFMYWAAALFLVAGTWLWLRANRRRRRDYDAHVAATRG